MPYSFDDRSVGEWQNLKTLTSYNSWTSGSKWMKFEIYLFQTMLYLFLKIEASSCMHNEVIVVSKNGWYGRVFRKLDRFSFPLIYTLNNNCLLNLKLLCLLEMRYSFDDRSVGEWQNLETLSSYNSWTSSPKWMKF